MASKAPKAKDFTNDRVKNRLGEVDELKRAKNHNKSKIRARVEHGGFKSEAQHRDQWPG